jgi:uncharacterized damage-inducible protein DinB
MTEAQLRYPIGKFARKENYSREEIQSYIDTIGKLPGKLKDEIKNLDQAQLDTPYREGGWTVRQVVHHLSDSHLNAYVRIKWTITENTPTIKAYDEKAWAETPETLLDPGMSIALLQALHHKWTALLSRLDEVDRQKKFTHPETGKEMKIDAMVAMYAWHGEHHLNHIISLKKRMNWS